MRELVCQREVDEVLGAGLGEGGECGSRLYKIELHLPNFIKFSKLR